MTWMLLAALLGAAPPLDGRRWSETLGYGHRKGDAIELVFEYPDGPFHTTFRKEGAGWRILMEQRDPAGQWKPFADELLRKR